MRVVLRIALVIAFGTAAGTKALSMLGTLPSPAALDAWFLREPVVAWCVVAIESIVAIALLTPLWRWGTAGAMIAGVVFSAIGFATVATGGPIETCGCFGGWQPPSYVHVAMIAGIVLASYRLGCDDESPRIA